MLDPATKNPWEKQLVNFPHSTKRIRSVALNGDVMFVFDDPVLALIARFVAREWDLNVTDEVFLQRQVERMKCHLARYSEQVHDDKAIEWLAHYATQYRDQWRNRATGEADESSCCKDCPMNTLGEASHCQIHVEWFQLLERYNREELSSPDYVKAALEMLRAHKQELKVRKQHEAAGLRELKAYRNARNQPL